MKVATWPVWKAPRRLLPVLLAVETAAVMGPVWLWSQPSRAALGLAILLASLSVTYSLFVVRWEQARQHLLFEWTPAMTPNVLATWCFAAAIMLPASLAAVVTAIAAIGDWHSYNAAGKRTVYRFVYSSATAVCAALASNLVFGAALPVWVGLPVAAAVYPLVGALSMVAAMTASGQSGQARRFLHVKTYRLEIITVVIGAGEYGLHVAQLPLVWLSLPLAVGILRYEINRGLKDQRRADAIMPEASWLHIARLVVQERSPVTVIRVNTENPRAAQAIARMNAGCDLIGRYGTAAGSGLAILQLDCPAENGDALAARLRTALRNRGVDCEVVATSTPRDGQTLDDLLTVSSAELLIREASRRSASSS